MNDFVKRVYNHHNESKTAIILEMGHFDLKKSPSFHDLLVWSRFLSGQRHASAAFVRLLRSKLTGQTDYNAL